MEVSPLKSFFDSPQLSVSLKVHVDRTAKWAKYARFGGYKGTQPESTFNNGCGCFGLRLV